MDINTTDCEKIECKFGKDFSFVAKFEEAFNVKKDDDDDVDNDANEFRPQAEKQFVERQQGGDVNKKVMEDIQIADTHDEDLEKPQMAEEEQDIINGELSNSCDVELKENYDKTEGFANFTKMEDSMTMNSAEGGVLTPPPPPREEEESLTASKDADAFNYDDALHPLSERWSPVGANYDDAVTPTFELLSPESELELLSCDSQDKHDYHYQDKHDYHQMSDDPMEIARLKSLEDEQEMLTSSLMALTSHFAHVQLRVRQIVEAPANERDQLLKDLEEFAFQGIPDTSASLLNATNSRSMSSLQNHDDDEGKTNGPKLDKRQFELIDHLKSQLTELEKIAYESGAPVLPQHILLEKQKIIIDELKSKLNFKVDEQKLPGLSAEELKSQVDNAIGEFVGPLKMKEQLVAQLKTQITDLERFIAFLQCDADESKVDNGGGEKLSEAYNSYAAKKKKESLKENGAVTVAKSEHKINANAHLEFNKNVSSSSAEPIVARDSLQNKAHGLMDKASLLMHMFATTHFGAKQELFQKNILKKTNKGNHWGDLRAQLEVDIQEVASLAATLSFDREKLAKLRKSMKKTTNATVATTASSSSATSMLSSSSTTAGIVNTIPPRNGQKIAAHHQNQLKPYRVSSDSDDDDDDNDDDDDDFIDGGMYYKWHQQNNRRMAQCARMRGDTINTLSKELTAAVRKNFSMTLLKLIQHGLRLESMPPVTSSLIVPFMRCLNPSPVFVAEHNFRARDYDASSFMTSSAAFGYDDTESMDATAMDMNGGNGENGGLFSTGSTRPMHAWELILEYYYLKHGDEYNNTPARKLSQSFNLDIVNSQAVTAKQHLLSVVGSIIAMHRPYKRSYNAHFKAFVCAGLNSHQLVEWLNLIFSCNDLVESYYTANSYVACTGFRDALRSIDALNKYDFDLPVDLAIRHFRNL